MYCGDEIRAVIVDVGSATTKIGESGEGNPRRVFSSAIGVECEHEPEKQTHLPNSSGSNDGALDCSPGNRAVERTSPKSVGVQPGKSSRASARKFHVGENMFKVEKPLRRTEVNSLFAEDGFVKDWDAMEALWQFAIDSKILIQDPSENPLLVTEPVLNPDSCQLKHAELLYEKFGVPALMQANQAVLAAFSVGRSCALVVDGGHQRTTISPVYDGYVLRKAVRQTDIGGRRLNAEVMQAIAKSGKDVAPAYECKVSTTMGARTLQRVSYPDVTSSYRRHQQLNLCQVLKESCCKISLSMDHEKTRETFALPDGTKVPIDDLRYRIPEFWLSDSRQYLLQGPKSIPNLILSSVKAASPDIRKALIGAITLCGGTCAFQGLPQRMVYELTLKLPSTGMKPRCINPANPEKINAPWIGGSILASLGSFQQKWCSKQEYEEYGATTKLLERCVL